MEQSTEMPMHQDADVDADMPDDYGDAYADGDTFEGEEPTDTSPQNGGQNSKSVPGSPNKSKGSLAAENTQSTMAATHDGFSRPADWPFSHRPVQPSHQQEWQDNTNQRLMLAKALTRDAQFQFSKNERAGSDSSRRHNDTTQTVHKNLKTKIRSSQDLTAALQERIDSIEDTMRQTGECLFQLQRAHRSKWAPLNVCERRLELRDSRPLQELVRDHFQQALEHERQTLIEARQELSDQIQGTKEMLASLEGMKQECVEDLQHKRHALRIDRSCLIPDKPHGREPDRFFLPALSEIANYNLPPSPRQTERGTGHEQEVQRQGGAQTLITRAVRLEEAAMSLCNENDAAMLHCKRECSRANAGTCVAMDRRTQEVEKMKRQLARQIEETEGTIAEAERSLQKTKKKLTAHEAPLRALNKQFSLRDQRTDREHIRDEVTDDMENQLDTVKKSVKALTNKWQSTKNILDHLKSSRQHMVEDLKCKTIAWKIDDGCRKVTPKKAIELDRMDPRGGRCHPDSKKHPSGRFQAILDDEWA